MIHSYTFTSDLTQKKKKYIYIYIPYKVIVKLKREILFISESQVSPAQSFYKKSTVFLDC